jgi:uncharacterized protein YkwD
MPAPSGPNRRRPSTLGIAGVAVAAVVIIAAALLLPKLLGQPPAGPSSAGALGTPAGSAQAPADPSTAGATPTTVPTVASSAASVAGATTPPPATGIDSLENAVLALTNTERGKSGCPTLRLDTKLRTAARNHSAEMASLGKLSHTSANGMDPGLRMKAAGYNPTGGWAENVAAGYPTPEAVMTGWMNSEGHRANILNCTLRALGVGAARASNGQLYWTQDFGGR